MDEDKQLYNMCLKGDIRKVRLVLARGGDPNKKVGTIGETALIGAADHGHQEVVRLLLEQPGITFIRKDYKETLAEHFHATIQVFKL